MRYFLETMNEQGTRPELEVYDAGMVNNAAFMINAGALKRPVYIQFVLGILGGLPATVENLVLLYNQARLLLGEFEWSVAAAGRFQFPIGVAALAMGGNVRVGLEDNVYLNKGQLATQQRRASREDGPHHPRTEPGTRHPRRSTPNPPPQGSRLGEVLRDV